MTAPLNEVKPVIDRTIRSHMDGFGVVDVEVEESEGYDGDPILRIGVVIDRLRQLDGRMVNSMVGVLRDALAPLGEERFPLVSFMTVKDREERSAAA